jgi:uncharacterized membrane protein
MEKKCFNRKKLIRLLYVIAFVLLLVGTAVLIYTLSKGYWQAVGTMLLFLALSLIVLLGAINKGNDVIIDYDKKEIESNIKFGKKESFHISFDAIVSIAVYSGKRLKNEIKLKKYPYNTLVIETRYHKEYIPLTFFDEETVLALIKELQKASENI